MGLVKLGTIAVDGTKVKANASRHKAMSYGHMLKAEADHPTAGSRTSWAFVSSACPACTACEPSGNSSAWR
jgi:hypothetical protein